MVLVKKTLDHGVNGYRSPVIPRAPRSIRKRAFRQKRIEGGQVCAFELLATVAGKLLEESECSSASSSAAVGFDQRESDKDAVKKEPHDGDKPSGGEHDDQGSSEGSVFFSGLQRDICKGKLETVNEVTGEHVSTFASSACSEKVDSDSKLVTQNINDVFIKHSCKLDGGSPKCGESDDTNIENGLLRKLDTNGATSGDITTANKSPAPTKFEENVDLTLCGGSNSNASYLKHGNGAKINCKDDDEILSRCSQLTNTMKAFRSPSCDGDSKLLTSKYWKTAPKLKDYEPLNTDGGPKHIYPSKRPSYEIDRSQRNTPFKKRRLLDRSSVVTYDGGISCESVSNSPEKKVIDDEKNASAGELDEGKAMPSPGFCRQKSCNSRNSHVRLSIKSFKVPELFIEVPESTTVGSLKKTVLEAVTTILGGGLRVGVLLQGKKIRDDNRTLLQSGISQSDNMDTVGFMLEPNSPTQPSPPICPEEPLSPAPCDSPKFVNRSQADTNDNSFAVNTPEKPTITDPNRSSGSIKNLILSSTTELTDKSVSDSKALVPVLAESMEALAVVPVNQRFKRPDIGQRRTRRPFSVSEVEALVRAVEKLGTGRWRDVKLCAFENAKHRTYVDLKDKWKTLVHTARISPQQRRGEPVPQDLLDRVLAAQSYWSEHQAKQHGKQQQGIIPKLTDSVAGKA